MTFLRGVCGLVVIVTGLSACAGDPAAEAQRFTESGDAYSARQQYAEAIIEYGRALQLSPTAERHFKLAEVYERSGESTSAFDEYAAVAELQPAHLTAQMKLGNALLAAGDFAGARHRAELALKADPSHAPGYVLLGNALSGLRDVKSALQQIERALAIDPASASAWTALGAARQAAGERREAAAAFEKAIAVDPSSAPAHVAAASFYWVNGDQARAEETLTRALTIEPSNREARRTLALLYTKTGRAPMAEPHMRALAVDPPGIFALAEYLTALSRHEAALAALQVLESHADLAVARTARLRQAAALHAAGRTEDAHRQLDAMMSREDDAAAAQVAKARLLLDEGRAADALPLARRAVARSSTPAAKYVLGLAAMRTGDLDTAAQAFSEVARLDPRSAEALLQLAHVRLAQGDLPAGRDAAEESVKREPRNAEAVALLVRTLREQGQEARARRELDGAAANDLQSPALSAERGWLALARGDARSARATFTDLLSTSSASDAQSGLVAVDLAERRFDAARERVAKWRSASRGEPRLALLAARVEVAAGRLDQAASLVQEAAAHPPTAAGAHELLGQIFMAQGRHGEALAQFEQAAQLSPATAARAMTTIGMLHAERGDREAARRAYERALAADPRAGVAANNLAWIYTETGGDLQEALRLAQVANEQMRRPESEDTLGWVYYQLGLPAQALVAFESARRRAPTVATYHFHAGLAFAKTGDRARAETALQKALALDPQLAAAREAYATLQSAAGESP